MLIKISYELWIERWKTAFRYIAAARELPVGFGILCNMLNLLNIGSHPINASPSLAHSYPPYYFKSYRSRRALQTLRLG